MNAFPTSTAWPQLQRCPTCLAVVPLWETLAHAQRHQTLAYSPSLASLSPHSRTFGLAPLDGFLQGSAPGFDSLFAEAALPSVPMRQPDWACDYPAASPYVESRQVFERRVTPDGIGGYYEDEIERVDVDWDRASLSPVTTPLSAPPSYQTRPPSEAINIPGAMHCPPMYGGVDPGACMLGMVQAMSARQQDMLGIRSVYGR